MSSRRTLPKGRLERITQLARMGAGAGLGYVTGKSSEMLAEQATVVLSSMRGLAAKVGQMASSFDGLLPESVEAPFANALARLRNHTDTSPYDEIVAVIESDLRGSITTLFQRFDPMPMASASIGQVHRATLPDGRQVAVKVQHPGIDRAMESDLSNVRLIERLAGAVIPKGLDSSRVYEEVSARFREELDYRIEAENQTRFIQLHRTTPGVVIPDVIRSHSARRVITTSLCEGRSFDEMLVGSDEAARREFATTLWRFVFRSILVGGEFNADPHAGNYLFGQAPQIVFLDFGCIQRLSPARQLAARRIHAAAANHDESGFTAALRDLLPTRGGAFEAFVSKFTRLAFEPVFASPFRMSTEYLRRLLFQARDGKLEVLRRRESITPFPPELALMNRLQFGFYSLLSKLNVEVDYAAIDRAILAEDEDRLNQAG
ncbi:MAG TPA: AarF/ABC1/UbiB kinase family protein [Polyangiaceae bacterium]